MTDPVNFLLRSRPRNKSRESPIRFLDPGVTHWYQVFDAVVEASEEAVLNALVQATTTDGRDGHRLERFPIASLIQHLKP